MYPIYLPVEGAGFNTYKEFETKFINICEEHLKYKRALCFAFIIYRERDVQIQNLVLRDTYLQAFNEISGEHFTVFAFIAEQKDILYNVLNINLNIAARYASNLLLDKYFNVDKKNIYPSILFFQVSDKKVVRPFIVSLKEIEQEKAYNEIKQLFEVAEKTLKNFDYMYDKEEIINQVYRNIRELQVPAFYLEY